jgi:hypothetical protein
VERLHTEQFRDLYSSSSVIIMIKSRTMRWAGHVARMGEEERIYAIGGKAGWKTTRKTKT